MFSLLPFGGWYQLGRYSRPSACSALGMLISFFPEIDFRFEKINIFSIIDFWFCASLTVLMLQSHYVLART